MNGRTLPSREEEEERGALVRPSNDPGLVNIEREYQSAIDAFRRSRAVIERMKEQDEQLKAEYEGYAGVAVTFGGGVPPEKSPTKPPPGVSSPPSKDTLFTREPAVIVGGLMSILIGVFTIGGYAASEEELNAYKAVLELVVPTLLPLLGSLLIRKKVTDRERSQGLA